MGTTSGITGGSTTITPTAYSFNATCRTIRYRYTGNGVLQEQLVPHGLGVTPELIIVKKT